jgi:DNA helicase HerA-like ATPase
MTEEKLGFVTVKDYDFPTTFCCWAILSSLDVVKKGSFVTIEDAKKPHMRFIGQVIDIENASTILKESSREEMLRSNRGAEDIIKGALSEPAFFKVYAKIKLMYKIEENNVTSVDIPPADTSPIMRSDLQYLPQILGFSQDPKTSICLGALYSHPDVRVCLDLNRMLSGHIAIFGQTHSGKSYTAGVIIEEVVGKGIPVLVFDHMGEYLSMAKTIDGKPGLNLIILRPGKDITIDFDDLIKASPILTTLGITDAQLNLLKDAYTEAQIQAQKETAREGVQAQKVFRGMDAIRWLLSDVRIPNKPRETRKRLYVIGRRKGYSTATIDGLRWKLEALLNKGIIGAGFDISDVIKPGYLTVVDLSTVDQSLRSLVVAAMLSKITEARKRNAIRPLLVVIEEAHNYVPPEETPSSVMIRDLIRGARHWGIGIMLVSQRPSGIHRDTINVANTHIIFRLKGTDLEYVKQFAPFTKEELEDVQILPDGVAYITGPIIRGGLSIKVATRKRRTVHGGQSIKFLDT